MADTAALLERYAEAKNCHDLESTLACCADDASYSAPSLNLVVKGKPALAKFYEELFRSLPGYYAVFDGRAIENDTAIVWGAFGGTTGASFMGIPVESGRNVEVPVTFVCTFRDGLLADDKGYFDASSVAEQVGVPLSALRPTPESRFVEAFRQFWSAPDPERVHELVAEDAIAYWPGFEPIRGADYPEHIGNLLSLVESRDFCVTGHAEAGDTVFISWTSRGRFGGRDIEWSGIDRFRLRDGKAVEIFVSYDTAPFANTRK